MTKSELISAISSRQNQLSFRDIELGIKTILEHMTDSLAQGKRIEIRGFGTYKIVNKKARIGRNPKNSEPVQIPEKKAIRWKISKDFLNRLNKNFTEKKISDNHTN